MKGSVWGCKMEGKRREKYMNTENTCFSKQIRKADCFDSRTHSGKGLIIWEVF